MKRVLGILCLISTFFLGQAQDTAFKPTLKIGDPAPEMTVAKWLKGTSQTNLNDGKVRVVEFWATWCGPCILGMPHLSQLANKYKQVPFIGVTASEKVDDPEVPQKFVDVSKNMMDYNVAYAVPKGPMGNAWLKGAGLKGIPAAFVIRKDGKIGWIGHPLMGLEEAVELAVKDKLTLEAADEITKSWIKKKDDGYKNDEELKLALKEGRTNDALRLNDSVIEKLPFNIAIASGKKYALLTANDPKAARAFGESLLVSHGNAPAVLKSVAATIFDGSDARVRGEVKVMITGKPDHQLAKKLILKALECSAADRQTTSYLERIQELESGNKQAANKS